MSRTFKFTMRVKDTQTEFAEGMGAGVLLTQEVVYKTAPDEDTPMFIKALLDQADVILNENIEVIFEEVDDPAS